MKVRSLFTDTPTRLYTWSVGDFRSARRWAKSQPDPDNKNQSLWDKVNKSGWYESEYILSKVNDHLKHILNTPKDKKILEKKFPRVLDFNKKV